jgi:hypothetical protein
MDEWILNGWIPDGLSNSGWIDGWNTDGRGISKDGMILDAFWRYSGWIDSGCIGRCILAGFLINEFVLGGWIDG